MFRRNFTIPQETAFFRRTPTTPPGASTRACTSRWTSISGSACPRSLPCGTCPSFSGAIAATTGRSPSRCREAPPARRTWPSRKRCIAGISAGGFLRANGVCIPHGAQEPAGIRRIDAPRSSGTEPVVGRDGRHGSAAFPPRWSGVGGGAGVQRRAGPSAVHRQRPGTDVPDREVIVVDDGSTDGTAAIATRFGERVRLVSQKNRGECAARNAGFSLARGEYITFVDHDDYWEPGFLESCVGFLSAHGGRGGQRGQRPPQRAVEHRAAHADISEGRRGIRRGARARRLLRFLGRPQPRVRRLRRAPGQPVRRSRRTARRPGPERRPGVPGATSRRSDGGDSFPACCCTSTAPSRRGRALPEVLPALSPVRGRRRLGAPGRAATGRRRPARLRAPCAAGSPRGTSSRRCSWAETGRLTRKR